MGRRGIPCLFSILCVLSAFGCDPVRTTVQSVRLKVLDAKSGQPVASVKVEMKFDFDRGYPLSAETSEPKAEQHARSRQCWEQSPWFSVFTDGKGEVEIQSKETRIDGTRGSTPPPERDVILGKPYLIKIAREQDTTDDVSLDMNPDATAKSKSYSVEVIDVQKPRYVPTD
jgi:hypothetical protein